MSAAEQVQGVAVDLAQARAFLSRLGTSHTFQTFDDSRQQRPGLARIRHGNLARHSGTLMHLNAAGAGVFVMVNGGDGKGRKANNVQQVRACFADLDGAPLEPVLAFPLRPHMVVESSPGRWHAYWLIADIPLEQFKAVQQAIARQFNADVKVCDLPRVMRVPGFLHRKGEPFLSRVIAEHEARPYSHEEIAGALGLSISTAVHAPQRRTLPSVIPEGERNDTLFKLARGLVHQGLEVRAIGQRLQKVNAERCAPPLCATEVDAIAANASAYGSDGFAMVPHALMDSPKFRALPPLCVSIVLGAYRQLNGHNNGNITLPWSEFKGRHCLMRSATFYRYRARVVNAGVLIQTAAGEITQQGKTPARFAIAAEFLPASLGTRSAPSASNSERAPKNINRPDALDAVPLPATTRNRAR